MNKIKKRIYGAIHSASCAIASLFVDIGGWALEKRGDIEIKDLPNVSPEYFLDYLDKTREQDDAMMNDLWRTAVFPKAKNND